VIIKGNCTVYLAGRVNIVMNQYVYLAAREHVLSQMNVIVHMAGKELCAILVSSIQDVIRELVTNHGNATV
jgi:hypothetical protein